MRTIRHALARFLSWVAGQPRPARHTVVPDWAPRVVVRIDSLDLVHIAMHQSHSDRLVLSLVMPRPAAVRLTQRLSRELSANPPHERKPR